MRTNRDISEQEYDETLETTQAIKECGRFSNTFTLYQACKWIKDNQTCKRYRGSLLDHYSACAYVVVYEALNDACKAKMAEIAEKQPVKAISIAFKLCK